MDLIGSNIGLIESNMDLIEYDMGLIESNVDLVKSARTVRFTDPFTIYGTNTITFSNNRTFYGGRGIYIQVLIYRSFYYLRSWIILYKNVTLLRIRKILKPYLFTARTIYGIENFWTCSINGIILLRIQITFTEPYFLRMCVKFLEP